MEFPHLSNESDRRPDDEKRRRFPINPVAKKAVGGWFNSPSAESSPKPTTESPQRMPVSIVAPEASNVHTRTMSHEAALHSGVWLGGQVRPPETAPVASPQPEAEFQHLLKRAGLDDLNQSFEQPKVAEQQVHAPAEQNHESERTSRSPRTRALIARAAGLITGSHMGVSGVRPELMRTLHQIDERMSADDVGKERGPIQPQEEQDQTDPFNVKPEEHVEQDAWHSIVMDKFGHEDMNARAQYGQGFRQEQKEILQSALSDTTPATQSSPTVPPSGMDTATQPAPSSQPSQPMANNPMTHGPVPGSRPIVPTAPVMPSLPDGLVKLELPEGEPVREDPQHLLPMHASAKTGISFLVNPWVWLIAGLLILVFFVASLIG